MERVFSVLVGSSGCRCTLTNASVGPCRLAHLALFLIRCRIAYAKGRGDGRFRFPTGQLTFELTIKLLREPQRDTAV